VTRPDVYASDRYVASQKLGEDVRASGGAGLLYDSLRRRNGSNAVAHRPLNITDILQTDHFEITVLATSRMIDVRKLSL
jgi:RES domain-containing protein